MGKKTSLGAACLAVWALGCGMDAETEGRSVDARSGQSAPFTVFFEDCEEFAGLFPVALTDVAEFVPEPYEVASFDGVTAIVVFRTAQCQGVEITGGAPGPQDLDGSTIVSQVGIGVVPPLGSGDVNNYTVHYGTNNQRLAVRLKQLGVNAQFVNKLDYDFTSSGDGTGEYDIDNPRTKYAHRITGPAGEPGPDDPSIPFVANWWRLGFAGNALMETSIDELFIGDGSQVVVTTDAGSDIAKILGGTSTAPPIFAIRGVIPSAVMEVFTVEI